MRGDRWVVVTWFVALGVAFGQPASAQSATDTTDDPPADTESQGDDAEKTPPTGGFLTDPLVIENEPKQSALSGTFPLWKSIAGDRTLPKPVSLAVVTYWQVQDYFFQDASIGIGNLPDIELDVSTSNAKIDSKSIGLKAGLWLLPFLEVTGAVGWTSVESDIVLRDFPVGVNPTPPGQPPEYIYGERLLELDFEGTYWSTSATLVGGWNRWFGALTVSYAKAKLDASVGAIGENTFTTERLLPKVGYSFEGTNIWIGAAWIDEEMHQTGSIDGFRYDVLVYRTDWTPVAGISTALGEHWEMIVEGGFGDRVSAMFLLGYRF